MTFDINKFLAFHNKLEWEGGIGELINYGWSDSTGDARLDSLWEQLDSVMNDVDRRVTQLYNEHSDELDKLNGVDTGEECDEED